MARRIEVGKRIHHLREVGEAEEMELIVTFRIKDTTCAS